MNKNNTAVRRILPLTLASLGALGGLQPAAADILLYDKDETTFSTDGYFNAFYVNSDVDRQGETYDRRQSRVKMGFLPNYIGFNFGRKIDELSLGGRASFWVTINDSETDGTDTAIDVRQFYGTVAGDWGEVLIGKDFGLFSRSNIFLDELLAGFGNPSDTLGLVDGKGVSFGNIGTGYPYPFPTSQITYRNNDLLPGLRIAVGILDPIDSNQIDKDASDGLDDKAYQDNPRYESEVSYQFDLAGAQVYSWINGGYQTSKNTSDSVDSVTSKGGRLWLAGEDGRFLRDRFGVHRQGHQSLLHQQRRRSRAARGGQPRRIAAGLVFMGQEPPGAVLRQDRRRRQRPGFRGRLRESRHRLFPHDQRQPQAGRRAEPLPDRRARRCRARRGHRHRGPRRRTELVIPLLSKDPAATQVG